MPQVADKTGGAVQIGPEDSVADVLAKTAVARAWLAERPAASAEVAALPETVHRLRISAHIPAHSPAVADVFQPALERLQSISGGRIDVEQHWGGKLHAERAGIEALKSGLTDLCPVYSAWNPGSFPAAQTLSLPFLFASAEVATKVSESLYSACFKADVERQNILMGRMVSTSAYNLFTHDPITSLAALRGRRVACSDGVEQDVFVALGAEPLACSTPEALRQFSAGTVAAVSISDSAAHTTGLFSSARYRTSLNMLRVSLEYGLSPVFYQALPQPLKVVFNDWLRALAQAGAQLFYGLAGARARQAFDVAGLTTLRLDDGEEARWRDAVAPVARAVADGLDRRGYGGAALVARLRETGARYAGWTSDALMQDAISQPARDMLSGLPAAASAAPALRSQA